VDTIDQQYSIRVKRRSDMTSADVYADYVGDAKRLNFKRTLRSVNEIEKHFLSRRLLG
jgi:hypothetical protein